MEQHPHRRPTPRTAQSRAEQPRTTQPQATRTVHVVENFDDFAGNAETLPVLMYHYVYTEEIVDDLKQAQAILGTTEAFAYPYGDNNENAWAAMEEAGYCALSPSRTAALRWATL